MSVLLLCSDHYSIASADHIVDTFVVPLMEVVEGSFESSDSVI